MNSVAIRAKNLKKIYRLYSKPSYRFRDIFGLLGDKPGAYTEHAALDGVDLVINRGERVAIIGRNGAGKSTFLKLVTGVLAPTSGTLEVAGKVHALLQIGTGFHPDFTGRENVFAFFAQLGITGDEARRKFEDVVEFAEIEEYIDQPVKTYSTGMGVRLMFSASTSIKPELLVLDEVLGVGDAYFAHKSFERMRELCERDAATLLLVTHDVYSAVRLCERLIWIDRGRVLHDADGPTVVAVYEDSIRLQEENRLRLKARHRETELAASARTVTSKTEINIEIQALHNTPQPCSVYFSRIELFVDGVSKGRLPVGGDVAGDRKTWLQFDGTSWDESSLLDGRHVRAFRNFGSPFHKVGGVVVVADDGDALKDAQFKIEAEFWSERPCELDVHCFVVGRDMALGLLPPSSAEWTTGAADGRQPAPPRAGGSSGRQGTGVIVVDRVRVLNGDGRETFTFTHGESLSLEFRYKINRPGLKERAQVLVAFQRDGVQDVMRSISRDLLFDEAVSREGLVTITFPKLTLANGSYSVTLMLTKEGYYDETQSTYFSLNPGVYTCLARLFEIVVDGGGIVGTGTGVVVDAQWSVIPDSWLGAAKGTARRLDFPDAISREFRDEFPHAWRAGEEVLARVEGTDLSKLAEHSPGLYGYVWTSYLQCSVIRLTRVLRALRGSTVEGARVLDVGSYFGNASLMCASAGYAVDAIDSYRSYSPALDGCVELLKQSRVRVLDFADCGSGLEKIANGTYDAVLCLGVIEHIPHTPRLLLETLNRVLKPGGVLVLDTPNIAYLYNRMKLAGGESVMPSLQVQFGVTPPFEGHHREYTTSELRWMLRTIGHEILHLETFNYSVYALTELTRDQLFDLGRMDVDYELRELMLSVSRKPS